MVTLKQIAEKIIEGEVEDTVALVEDALTDGITARNILNDGLLAGMDIVGQRFRDDEMFIPEVLMCAEAMSKAMNVLEPIFAASGEQAPVKVAVGTVKGDIHDIGKNMVITMLRGAGYNVTDLGIDLPAEIFVEEAKKGEISVLGMSALLTTTIPYMKTVIDALKEAGVRNSVKIIVGGAVVTQEFADEIGADLYAPDAMSAADMVREAFG